MIGAGKHMSTETNVSYMTFFFLCQTALRYITKKNLSKYTATTSDI